MALGKEYKNGSYWIRDYTLTTQYYKCKKRVRGFDFGDDRDTVWTEGTLQQALAFLVAGDIKRYHRYKRQSEKLRVPSGGFLLASNTGTAGFGWILERWQSVAPTSWYILVVYKYNILELL